MRALYSEALALSRKVGIPVAKFDKVIRGGRMDCGFYQTFMGYALEGNREAHKFTLGNAYKDMRYVESMANAATVATPLGSAVKNSYALAWRREAKARKTMCRTCPTILEKQMVLPKFAARSGRFFPPWTGQGST